MKYLYFNKYYTLTDLSSKKSMVRLYLFIIHSVKFVALKLKTLRVIFLFVFLVF